MEINLNEFIKKTIEEITIGLPNGYAVEDAINFEVSITSTTNKNGGVEIKVISGEIQKGSELVHTVSFSIINKIEKDKSVKKSSDTFIKYLEKGIKKIKQIN